MNQVTNLEFENMVNNTRIPIRIACITSARYPIVLSLWYTVLNGKIYCATQKKAKIVSHLKNNSLIGFEIAADNPPYRGIRGHGKVKILDGIGSEILEILIDKYLGNKISTLSEFLRSNSENEVAIEITPEKLLRYDYSERMKDA